MASSFSSSFEYENNAVLGNQTAMVNELVHGRDLTTRLRSIIDGDGDSDGAPAEILVSQIMETFTNTLVMLDKNDSSFGVENDSRFFAEPKSPKSEDSEESSNSVSKTETRKDRRGCYKRRKSLNSWQMETPNLIDDGHAWRKYGQKPILKSKYPRNYFRCTHKYDQKCEATKHVQRIQEEPPLFRTTYHGNHTCRNLLSSPELVLTCASPDRDNSNSMLLSFNLASKQSHDHPFFLSSFNTHVKDEVKEEQVIKTATLAMPYCGRGINESSSDNYIAFPDHQHQQPYDLSEFDHDHRRSDFGCGIDSFDNDVLKHFDIDY